MTREEYEAKYKETRKMQKEFSNACRDADEELKYHAEETESKAGKVLYTTGRVITGVLRLFFGGGQ